ncbi:MAG: sugar kinase [Chloroflexota bacterium]
MTFDITTFGEALLRLSVPEGVRLQAAAQFDVHPAGAETNIATLMARLGYRSAFHSILPNNPLGRLVGDHLRQAGVNLDGIIWEESGRLGTFFVEFATPPRAIQVIYDRADSCVAQMTPDMLHWDQFLDTGLVHLTGITPAVSPSCAETIQEIVKRTKAAKLPISFDINYRQKLWLEADARNWLTPVIQGIDLLFCGQGDAKRVFGIDGTPEQVVKSLAEMSGAKAVVVSLSNEGVIGWDGTQTVQQPALPVEVIDRIGAGDALACGVLHGWMNGDLALGLRYGVTLAALALSQHGDAVITTREEVTALVESTHALGTVQR